jgi:uncharacterized membrane protein
MGLRKGTPVHASDGEVGDVSTLELDDKGVITHFGVEKNHAELMLPVSAIDFVNDDGVHLKLNKAAVHGLPTMPLGHGRFGQSYRRMELVAKVFNEPGKAHEALEYLEYMAHSPGRPLRIREAAELVRDMDGTPRIVQSSQPSLLKGAVIGGAAGGLLTLLGPLGFVAGAAIGAGIGAAAGPKMDMGFPDAFLDRLEHRLEPGHSALVVLVEHDFARDLTDALEDSDKVIGGQQIVDTLVQELLIDSPVGTQTGEHS